MLFGRRKEGFSTFVIIEEFEAEINEDRINTREIEIELLDYFEELGNLKDNINPEEQEIQLGNEKEEKTKVQLLADFIRKRSSGAQLTSRSLLKDEEDLEGLLLSLREDESCRDIASIKGGKDVYYYSNQSMSDNYAMVAVLVDEKDLARTIAQMVRWNAKTYPCPTPVYYFKNSPYLYTEPQIERAIDRIKGLEEYTDIGELTTGNRVRYLYSTLHMSEKYARALAEGVEYGEYGY